MGRTRILLADDHTMICAGLAKLLEPHYEVVGSVEDGHALLKAADQLKPDVVVLDIGMPLLNGLDAARELKKRTPNIKLIFLTMEADSYIAAEAFRAGAAAYLLKTSRPTELLQAVHDAVRGVSYVTPQIGRAIENMFIRDPRAEAPKQLTGRQREVLQMLARGLTNKEIGSALDISGNTVRNHVNSIIEKLEVSDRTEAATSAIHRGLIDAHH